MTLRAVSKFKLLMWKNFLQQWRHKKRTIAEAVIPALTMCLVLIVRSQIAPQVIETEMFGNLPAAILQYSTKVLNGMKLENMSIAYFPKNKLLEDVLRTATGQLFQSVNIIPYDSVSELNLIYAKAENMRIILAAVQFPAVMNVATALPSKMQYELRFPKRPRLNYWFHEGGLSWHTDAAFPIFELISGPRFPLNWVGGDDPPYVDDMFLAVQHVISMGLISKYTGQDLSKFQVYMHKYPRPSFIYDPSMMLLNEIIPLCVMISYSYTAANIVRAITVEKEMQLKELMKIMGLPTWLHWTAWFWKQFIYLLLTAILIVVILKVHWFKTKTGFSNYAVFTHTSGSLLFFYIVLYIICIIFFCFMISGFFSKAVTATAFATIIWFASYIPLSLMFMDNISVAVQAFMCLSINTAMGYGFKLLCVKENNGGMQWSNLLSPHTVDHSRLRFDQVVLILIMNCFIYMLIALYMEQIRPGPFGIPQPYFFFLQKSYWKPLQNYVFQDSVDVNMKNYIVKEDDPEGLSIGVQMKNLTKVYGPNTAVNNLSLNIYDDQITVLLGHNGAGKSTTISMLTGNVTVTSGTVTVAGYDMATHTDAARAQMGLCPQHNVLFDELTVREHLKFFTGLKGLTGNELQDEINSLITKLELDAKGDYQSHGLSGGQKRRLCVGIAICGHPRVVLLDEPTSGMDPASRRALWDLLQKEKYGRSMILTTHFMDEADILGDRIAIMANGSLQCVGSPYFLKRHFGVGYTLVVVKDESFKEDLCTNLLNKYIPGIAVTEDRGTEVTYRLLNEYTPLFEQMLTDLEANANKINFHNYGLLASSLEDVFMTLSSKLHQVGSESSVNSDNTTYDFDALKINTVKIYGFRLWWLQMQGIWWKLWLVWTRSPLLILVQILVPLVLINTTLGFIKAASPKGTIQGRLLTLSEGYPDTETFLSFSGSSKTSLGAKAKLAYEFLFAKTKLPHMILTEVQKPIEKYYVERINTYEKMYSLRRRLLIGATFEDNSAIAWFSNYAYHDLPISLAAIHAAILSAIKPEATIAVSNHPLDAAYPESIQDLNPEMFERPLSSRVAEALGTSLSILSSFFIVFYIKERTCRTKLMQKVSGVQPVVMWCSAALFDFLWFTIVSLMFIISFAAFQVMGLSTYDELGRTYLLIIIYGVAMLSICYVFSYLFNGPGVGFVSMFFINVFFALMVQVVKTLEDPILKIEQMAKNLDLACLFYPMYSLIRACESLNWYGIVLHTCFQKCDFLENSYPDLKCDISNLCKFYSKFCCVEQDPYWNWKKPGVMKYIVAMIATFAIMWTVLMIVEYRLVKKIFYRERSPPPWTGYIDDDVLREADTVDHVGTGLPEHSLVAQSLTKYYSEHVAVNKVSFTVSNNECFGLLGINGAGKTSIFKMLIGDEVISSGDAYVAGKSVKTEILEVFDNVGYVPQFDAMFTEFTGRETIRFFGVLRGLDVDTIVKQTDNLAYYLGFKKHIDKKVYQYSGGNRRKLSLAVALLGNTRLLLVDEPTTGVDPAAKRQVWAAIRGARRMGRGVVLTSHSMEECEALCTRLTIMVNGRFQCLGTPQHLKNKFSQGFTLNIKMNSGDPLQVDQASERIKAYVSKNFNNPVLMEEYQGLMTYYLPDVSVPWSQMFGIMERAKKELSVEDYNILQTTLEQVFLLFTKFQKKVE